MKPRVSINTSIVKNMFKREQEFSNKCKICDMEFPNPERTKKHMMKAHTKPKREKQGG